MRPSTDRRTSLPTRLTVVAVGAAALVGLSGLPSQAAAPRLARPSAAVLATHRLGALPGTGSLTPSEGPGPPARRGGPARRGRDRPPGRGRPHAVRRPGRQPGPGRLLRGLGDRLRDARLVRQQAGPRRRPVRADVRLLADAGEVRLARPSHYRPTRTRSPPSRGSTPRPTTRRAPPTGRRCRPRRSARTPRCTGPTPGPSSTRATAARRGRERGTPSRRRSRRTTRWRCRSRSTARSWASPRPTTRWG